MKTLLIITDETQQNHAGEEVDDYMIVDPIIEHTEMPIIANGIRNKIREMVIEEKKDTGNDVQDIEIVLDASPLYDVIIVGLADTMSAEEGLKIHLPERLNRGSRDEEEEVIVRED